MLADQRGITGLETAIVLIAFVVVAAVFAFAVLSTGLLSEEKTKESVLGALEESGASIAIRGSVIANKASGSETVESIVFQVANASQAGESVDLSRSGSFATLITYIDDDQVVNLTSGDWLAAWLIGSGDLLSAGERAEIRVTLTGLSTLLGVSKEFALQVKPTVGAVLEISRTTPAEFVAVMDLR